MGQRVIPCAITAEYVAGDGVTLGAAGSHSNVVIEFDFRAAGPMWEGTTKYVLWTNPQGNSTNRVDLGVDKLVDGYENVYHASPTADAMCVAGWCEMVVVGVTVETTTDEDSEESTTKEVLKVKTEPSRFRVLPGSSRASDNEGIAATVADQLQTEIEAIDKRKVNKPAGANDPYGEPGQVLKSLGDDKTIWADPDIVSYEQVEEVLKNHQDWVTTVQDGSISSRHLASDLIKTVDTFDDLADTTEDEVLVLQDDSYYGSGQSVVFMVSPNALDTRGINSQGERESGENGWAFFKRNNGDYMVPKPRKDPRPTPVPTASVGRVIASYFKEGSDVYTYGGVYTAHTPNYDAHGDLVTHDLNQIDCSEFAYLVMQGIAFEHSRYADRWAENIPGQYVGGNIPRRQKSKASWRQAYNVCEMALYFAEQNALYYIDYSREHPASQLQPGDLLFESDPEGEVSSDALDRYLYTHHVVVVLQTFPADDRVLIAQVGGSHAGTYNNSIPGVYWSESGPCRINFLEIKNNPTKHVIFARPNYGTGEETELRDLIDVVDFKRNVTPPTPGQNVPIAEVWLKQPLKAGQLYTWAIKGDLPTKTEENLDIVVATPSASETPGYRIMYPIKKKKDTIIIPTYTDPSAYNDATHIYICAHLWGSEEQMRTDPLNGLDAVSLYEGLVPDVEPSVADASELVSFDTELVTVEKSYVWRTGANLNIRARLTLNVGVESDHYETIGQVQDWVTPAGNFSNRNFSCVVGTDVRDLIIQPNERIVVRLITGDASGTTIKLDVTL